MPELPEVQTIVDDMKRKIRKSKIVAFWTDWEKAIKFPLKKFTKIIIGSRIKDVQRRGKNILIFLDNDYVIHVHLKMTGHLLIKTQANKGKRNFFFKEKVNQYIHHIWSLRDVHGKPGSMEFSDLRKFGKIRIIAKGELKSDHDLNSLGIEPLSKEFTRTNFGELLKNKGKLPLRKILMEQTIIAGIGNIYASEIMFESGIAPERKADSLSEKEIEKLHEDIRKVLKKAVKLRGTSDSDYRDTDGAPGGFQDLLKVYNREGELCKRKKCQGVVKRLKVNQRSAFWCDGCQK